MNDGKVRTYLHGAQKKHLNVKKNLLLFGYNIHTTFNILHNNNNNNFSTILITVTNCGMIPHVFTIYG
jgi:hypothetical protein